MTPISVTVPAEAITPALVDTVSLACDRAEDAGAVLVLRIAGAAKDSADSADSVDSADSAAGARTAAAGVHLVNRWERALRRLERLTGVTVAALSGTCSGVALEVLLATDHRVLAEDTRLRLPRAGGGCWPGMALHRLASQFGVVQARRLLLGAPELSAERLVRLGLADEVSADLEDRLPELAEELRAAAGPDWAIRRRLLLDAVTTGFEDALGAHLAACDRELRVGVPAPNGAGEPG